MECNEVLIACREIMYRSAPAFDRQGDLNDLIAGLPMEIYTENRLLLADYIREAGGNLGLNLEGLSDSSMIGFLELNRNPKFGAIGKHLSRTNQAIEKLGIVKQNGQYSCEKVLDALFLDANEQFSVDVFRNIESPRLMVVPRGVLLDDLIPALSISKHTRFDSDPIFQNSSRQTVPFYELVSVMTDKAEVCLFEGATSVSRQNKLALRLGKLMERCEGEELRNITISTTKITDVTVEQVNNEAHLGLIGFAFAKYSLPAEELTNVSYTILKEDVPERRGERFFMTILSSLHSEPMHDYYVFAEINELPLYSGGWVFRGVMSAVIE